MKLKNMKSENPRVAIYMRVSTQIQATDMQRIELERYASARGWRPMFFEDKSSGTNEKRPAFQELVRNAKAREFDIVLVWKLDRFARSLKSLVMHLQEFQELGIEFVSLRDNLDLTTASGRLMMQMIAAFGEFEASLIKERVRSGLQNAKSKGIRLGRPASIDTKAVIQLRANGLSIAAIARQLNCSKAGVHKVLQTI